MLSDREYEKKLDEFNQLAGAVKSPPVPKLYIGAAKWKPERTPDPNNRDKQGRSLDILAMEERYMRGEIKPDVDYTKIGRSLIRNYYNIVTGNFCSVGSTGTTWGDGNINYKNLSGTVISYGTYSIQPAGVATTTYGNYLYQGIHVGTDNTAVSIDDYACISQIAHGDGAGQLRYWDMLSTAKSYNAGTRVWTQEYIRYFTNHSGGSITVSEMALVAIMKIYTTNRYFAIARDLLSPALAIGNLEVLRCKYTCTFPAFPA